HNLGNNFAWPESRRLDIGDRIVRRGFLIFVGVKDRRPIAGADVVALAVFRRRVVNLEEEFQQLSIADLLWIENDLDRFGVRPVFSVSRIGDISPRVADPRRDHAWILANKILHAPEAAAGEYGAFG